MCVECTLCVCLFVFCNLLRTISGINIELIRTNSPYGVQKTGPNLRRSSDSLDGLEGMICF